MRITCLLYIETKLLIRKQENQLRNTRVKILTKFGILILSLPYNETKSRNRKHENSKNPSAKTVAMFVARMFCLLYKEVK